MAAVSRSASFSAPAPLRAAKLRSPALHPSWRERERISSRLDEAILDSTRLTVVSAPPGYGKTVALVGWLASRRLPHAWLTLDEADDDPARLVRYLVAALSGVRPGIGEGTLGLVSTGSAAPPQVIASTLVEEVSASDDGFVLVLDDYQSISSSAAQSIVRALIDQVPPFAHVLILTRADPSLPLGRLRASGRLLELHAADLRLSEDEAAEYLAATGIEISPGEVRDVVDRTEGWPAGLQLASLLMRGRPGPADAIRGLRGSHRFVLEYLAGEVMDRLDESLRDFLVRTSIADRFTVELATELGAVDAGALLERAEQLNLFLLPLEGAPSWFRYHRLFADYLRTLIPLSDAPRLHLRAARYFEAQGLATEAIDHALTAGDAEYAARLIGGEARKTFDSGELATLIGWLRRLPPGRVDADPELAGLGAWALFLTGELTTAGEWAARSLARDDEARPNPRLLVAAANVAVLAEGDTRTADELASKALELLGDDAFFRSQALLVIGEIRLSEGRLADAVETMRDALEIATRSRQPIAIFPIAYLLTVGMNAMGRRAEAEALCRRLLAEHSDARGRPLPIAGFARIALGALRYEANDLDEARQELERGFRDAEILGFGRFMLGQAAGALAAVRAATGAPDLAVTAVTAGATHARDLRMAPAMPQSDALAAQMALARGDLESAARWADSELVDPSAAEHLIPRVRFQRDIALARILLAQRRADTALDVLRPAREIASRAGAVPFVVSLATLDAAANEIAGRHVEAGLAVAAAIDIGAPSGYVRRVVEDGRGIVSLIAAARDRAPDFVDAILAGLGDAHTADSPQPVPSNRGVLVEPLTSRELDVLRLMAQGKSNAHIADELVVSLATAKWHVSHVLAKVGATNRTDALVKAQHLGLV